ncbi:MAG: hypothetical protein ABSF80_13715 [Chitinispirillaceae bacterium]|jgi:hypothetical protein
MVGKNLKYPVLVLYTTALMLFFYTGYFNRLLLLPQGCDEFGYLNMAKAVSQGNLFKDHVRRPFDRELIEYLKQSPHRCESAAHLICPPAYWFDTKKIKVINQYPPGTGILLSPLPLDSRKTAFPAVVALLLVFFLFLAFKTKSGGITFFNINAIAIIAFLVFMASYFPHGFDNFSGVNSYAPTFGMLLAAGYLLDKRPWMSIALLGMSTIFRIANVIIFVPFLFVYLGRDFNLAGYFSKETLLRTLKAMALLLAGGLGLYFLYVWILLGNPLSPTYSEVDQQFALLKDIPGNISYYLGFFNRWFVFHIVVLGLMACMGIVKKMPVRWIIISTAIALFNYCFYFVHRVKIEYYTYASGVIIAGIFLYYAEEYIRNTKFRRMINYAGVTIFLAAVVCSILWFPRQNSQQLFNTQIKEYNDCFSMYDVVWAEHGGGTMQFATGKAAFRMPWGPEDTRKEILLWLHVHGYRQAIWMSDFHVEAFRNIVKKELKDIPLDYTEKTSPVFGTIFEIQ